MKSARQPVHTPLRPLAALRGACLALVLGIIPPGAALASWHGVNMRGTAPPLRFTMVDADLGHVVTARNFRGKVVMLYLGYTHCPDVCPLTLQRVAAVLGRLGPARHDVRLLFVTVDPARDSLAELKQYTAAFAPEIVGLRGNSDQITRLAKRYRLAFSAVPETASHPYEVTHASAIYVFDRAGLARLLEASLASQTPDIAGTAADLRQLLAARGGGALSWLDRAP